MSSYINWHDGQESRLADVYFMELNCYKLLKYVNCKSCFEN